MRYMKRILQVSLLLLALPPLLFGLALLALQREDVRTHVAAKLIGFANGAMDEKLTLEGIERLNPWGVRVHHVVMHDAHGRLIVDAYGVDATINLLALLYQTVDIKSARVDRGLLALPMLTDPIEAEEPEEDDPADDTPSAWRVKIPVASVGDCRFDLELPIGALRAHARDVSGGFYWQETYRVVVQSAQLTADLDGERALTAELRESEWRSDTGGHVKLSGKLVDAQLDAEARLSGLEITTPWPQGDLRLRVAALSPTTLSVFGVGRGWLKRPVDLSVHLHGDEQRLHVDSDVAIDEKRLELEGTWDKEQLSVSADIPTLRGENVSNKLPEGNLAGRLVLRYALEESGALYARFRDVVVADVHIPDGQLRGRRKGQRLSVEELTLRGYEQNLRARGGFDLGSNEAQATVDVTAFNLAQLEVVQGERLEGVLDGELRLRAREPTKLQLTGQLVARQLKLRQFRAERVEATIAANGSVDAPEGTAQVAVAGLSAPHVPFDRLNIDARFHDGEGRAQLEGEGEKTSAKLAVIVRREKGYTLNGTGTLEHEGHTLELRADLQEEANGFSAGTVIEGTDGTASLRVRKTPRMLTANIAAKQMDLAPLFTLLEIEAEKATIDGDAELRVPVVRGSLALTKTHVRADLTAALPVAPLMPLTMPSLGSLAGTLTAELHAQGTLQKPEAELRVRAELSLPERDSEPEELDFAAKIGDESALAELTIADMEGPLLELSFELGGALQDAIDKLNGGEELPSFTLTGEIFPRRLDLMQGVIAYLAGVYALDYPVKVAGKIKVAGKDSELSGEADLRVRLFGDAIDEACVAGAFTDIDVGIALDKSTVQLRVKGYGDKGGEVLGELSTRLRFSRHESVQLEPAKLSIKAERLRVHTLPGLCSLTAGIATGSLRAEGLGGSAPTADLHMDIDGLSAGGSPALALAMTGKLGKESLMADAKILSAKERVGLASVRVPLVTKQRVPEVDLSRPAKATLTLDKLPVAPFLSIGEHVGRARGTVSGKLTASGNILDPDIAGYVELERVGLSIASIAQPFRGIGGRIEVRGRKLTIRGVTARDGNGDVHLDGEAQLAEDWSGNLALKVKSERFPIRRQGEIVGEVTTEAAFTGKLDKKLGLDGEVRIRGGRVWFTGESGGKVQDLDKHEEIRFVDAKGMAEAARARAAEEAEEKEPTRSLSLTQLRVQSDKDLWFMHSDFSVQLGIDLQLVQEDDDEKLVGEVKIRRGHLQLIGKPFDIEQGSIRLTGDYPPDPELDLKAAFQPSTGRKLFVEVHGRASAPNVTFSGAASTAEEAIAIVSGLGTPRMGGADQRAQSDARGFATNITAGLLSATARRRLGDWVPLISVESDMTGAPSRARAGFDASKLIPHFLRPLARGAYVEGIVGDTRQTRAGTVGVGVRLEVALPRDFVSSMGYGPGPTWRTDLSWVP